MTLKHMSRPAAALVATLVAPLAVGSVMPTAAAPATPNLGFTVDVSLTPKAAAKLAAIHEQIKVSAYWYGEPSKLAPKKEITEEEQIVLGSEMVQLPGSGGTATITGKSARANHLDWLKDRAVSVNVNVYTARLVDENNLIDCDLVEGPLAEVQAKPNKVMCKLIGEK